MWKGKGHKPSHCLVMRRVNVCGILAPEKNTCVPHSEEIWPLRRNLMTSPGGRHIPHTFVVFLYPHSSQTGRTQMCLCGRSKQEPYKLSWTTQISKSLHVHLYCSNHAFRFYIPTIHIFSLYLGCISYSKWKNWCIFKIFFPHLCISTAVTLKDTLQMNAEFLHCLQQQALQS